MLETPVQAVPPDVFRALREGDMLLVDSSHVAKTRSDVLDVLFRILPLLAPGVLIHFHDVLWPFEYPEIWLEEGRAWNEAYFVRAFLAHNAQFEILLFNSFLEHCHPDLLAEHLPLMLKPPASRITPGNSSLWIRRVG